MLPEVFFDLFIEELKAMPDLQAYYKFLNEPKSWHFRRNYFLTRLRYIKKYIVDTRQPGENINIWDCGCGYGTTCLYLAMNGIQTYGTTLEFYMNYIDKRKQYWSSFGDSTLFSAGYEYLFDNPPPPAVYDWVIVQDTLHHLEPLNDAIQIFKRAIKTGGKILAIEENGSSFIKRIMGYRQRGNKRIIEIWDEKLQKKILIGNENIRSFKTWEKIMEHNGFSIIPGSRQHIRFFWPWRYRFTSPEKLLAKEQAIQQRNDFRSKYFFMGVNFVAEKI
ncbi:MAG TPA: class I SAM-dependent methyltransferase [Chitinophagaceae bacterium]|nr:class I SAM-dependent methyltransferase [Chitinophagaceae bacterium]